MSRQINTELSSYHPPPFCRCMGGTGFQPKTKDGGKQTFLRNRGGMKRGKASRCSLLNEWN